MASQITVREMNKQVRVWSGRRNREVIVEVDYHRIDTGDFTLFHIARMRDCAGWNTDEPLAPRLVEIR